MSKVKLSRSDAWALANAAEAGIEDMEYRVHDGYAEIDGGGGKEGRKYAKRLTKRANKAREALQRLYLQMAEEPTAD